MTYYVQPVPESGYDPTTNWEGYGLASLGWDANIGGTNITGGGPSNLNFGADDYSDFGGGFDPYGSSGGSGQDYSDFGGGFNPYQQGNENYGYEYGETFDPYGNGTGMNANYGYDYGNIDYNPFDSYDGANYGYEYGGASDNYGYSPNSSYAVSGGGVSPGTRWEATDYGQYTPTVYGSGGGSNLSAPSFGGGPSYNTNRSSSGRPPPPRPPSDQPQPGSARTPLVSAAHIPLPDISATPTAPNYNILPQQQQAWDRLQNFLNDPMKALEGDPQYQAMLAEGNRNLAAKHRGKRTRFSGMSGVDFEKFGVEAANQNLDRIARTYGDSAAQELQRWIPAATLDFQRQTQGFDDSLDRWRAENSANFMRYGASQGDVRNLLAVNAQNVGQYNNYYANQGAQDMLQYFMQMQDYYGD